jgi:streptomycin 6-kinase
MVRDGLTMLRELAAPTDRPVVLLTDLHAQNVLASQREPWLAIDPKPYVGDPTYDALQHMLNVARLHVDPLRLVARMSALLDLDSSRLKSWLFARCAVEAVEKPDFLNVMQLLS